MTFFYTFDHDQAKRTANIDRFTAQFTAHLDKLTKQPKIQSYHDSRPYSLLTVVTERFTVTY